MRETERHGCGDPSEHSSTTAGGVPALLGGRGTPSSARYINTLEANATIETKRKTALGDLETTFMSRWAKTSDDGTNPGTATVQELKASLKGGTVGYTDSLMNFWSEDFLFTATSPKRTIGIASYERDITDDAKLAIAIEFGLPTSRQYNQGIAAVNFNSPLATARWLYQNDDDWSFQLSGLLRQATANTGAGWATTVGATMPTKAIGDNDYVSMQTTYAVNASPFLGTAVDLSALASSLPTTATTRGWSTVVSFHHEWSEQWETNVFASYLALNAELALAQPTVRTKRYGVNLYWRPIDDLRLGVELGHVETELAANGPFNFLSGVSGRALVGYLNVQWSF